ncbi:SEL1-like repeat protein [Candidatus Odyssella acanthamoebae]|uniref:Uncharacterized protein n=1 Tax=Candidatus Odyssella acanthamoebae TaxID=91604 RepID=A0A077AW86_9PROT|nr:SEL1-like repeat protein [Candidatus Paracaedibacter acanthamoebae]AIK96314.1 hypothetical protein ID47_05540 [Candidatus Paracaedibacter acanthamoebae]
MKLADKIKYLKLSAILGPLLIPIVSHPYEAPLPESHRFSLGKRPYEETSLGKSKKKGSLGEEKVSKLTPKPDQKRARSNPSPETYYQRGITWSEKQDHEQAFCFYRKAAKKGHIQAQYKLGRMYQCGLGVKMDNDRAFFWYEKAARQKYAKARYRLGSMYEDGLVGQDGDDCDLLWYKKAAKQGYLKAQCRLGHILMNMRECDEAESWYKKAAEEGHLAAQWALAEYYRRYCEPEEGKETEALYWYEQLAKQGWLWAQYEVANIYHQGLGVEKNDKLAFYWYEQAANQKHKYAQYELGKMYWQGLGIEKNDKLAFYWYEQAANKKQSYAQYELGKIYHKGLRVKKNGKLAIKWYRSVADQPASKYVGRDQRILYTKVLYRLGQVYLSGLGSIEKDERQAFHFYKKAAERGHIHAQYHLSKIYLDGIGVEKSEDLASHWRKKAFNKDSSVAANLEATQKVYIPSHREAMKWYKWLAEKGGPIDRERALKALEDYDSDSEEEGETSSVGLESSQVIPSSEEKWVPEAQAKASPTITLIKIQKKLAQLNKLLSQKKKIDFSKYPEFHIALYRGVHYLPEIFHDKDSRKEFRTKDQVGSALFSATACSATGLEFLSSKQDDFELLESHAQVSTRALAKFKHSFPKSYHKFHETYSNSHKDFHKLLKEPLLESNAAGREERAQAFVNYIYFLHQEAVNVPSFRIESAILRNPHVSFSLIPFHAVKYALGAKSFYTPTGDKARLLRPEYDADGVPKHSYLGKVYVSILTLEDFFKQDPYLVLRNHALGRVKITTHYNNKILKEDEVTLSGYLPANRVIATRSIRCPRFDQDAGSLALSDYQKKHGISPKIYQNYKKKLEGIKYQKDSFAELEKLTKEDIFEDIATHQDKELLRLAKEEARKRGGVLIYPGLDNDFVLRPLSFRAADYYRKMQTEKQPRIIIDNNDGQGRLEPEELIYLLQKLKHNKSIQYFKVTDIEIGDRGFNLLAEILRVNTTLTSLLLEGTSASNMGIKVLVNALEQNGTLTELSLAGNKKVGSAIGALAKALTSATQNLKILDLEDTGLTDQNVEPLVNIFKGPKRGNTKLHRINLGDNKISKGKRKPINGGIKKNLESSA